ncbi:MAG: hypothetical protein ABI867_22445 [Kofleriaceae bacterium]
MKKQKAKRAATKKKPAPKRAKRVAPKKKQPVVKAKAKAKAKTKAKTKKKAKPASWPKFVERHGVVLASARGPVPSVAEAIAGEVIVGSWWSHPKAQTIFDALSSIDDSDDIRCFKLVDKKITFVHRRAWPALVKLAQAGILERARVEAIEQEHMPTGEHRNFTIPYPDWVPNDVSAAAESLSIDDARQQLGSWL